MIFHGRKKEAAWLRVLAQCDLQKGVPRTSLRKVQPNNRCTQDKPLHNAGLHRGHMVSLPVWVKVIPQPVVAASSHSRLRALRFTLAPLLGLALLRCLRLGTPRTPARASAAFRSGKPKSLSSTEGGWAAEHHTA